MFRVVFSSALAIFAMFFGAGNVVFPLLLGKETGSMSGYAILGLLLTAIGGPLIGLCGATLFEGKFKEFFGRSGKIGGYILMAVSSILLGPLAVMPRCVAVSHAALLPFFPSMSMWLFSLIAAVVSVACIYKRSKVLPILGYVLSPILIVLLIAIIVKGALTPSLPTMVDLSAGKAFVQGLTTGYDTMDLIASIFFAVSIWHLLRTRLHVDHLSDKKRVIKITLLSGLIAGLLLGAIYVGLCAITANQIPLLEAIEPQNLLTHLSYQILGPHWGALANWAIALACITTIMSLATTFSEIFRKDFFFGKLSHFWTVTIIMAITALFSNLGFKAIMAFIHPIVALFYPAIIVLTLCNIAHKLWGFKPVKIPVAATFFATLIFSGKFF